MTMTNEEEIELLKDEYIFVNREYQTTLKNISYGRKRLVELNQELVQIQSRIATKRRELKEKEK